MYEEIRALEREALERVNEALDDGREDAEASREDALTRAKACALRVRALIEESVTTRRAWTRDERSRAR